jgi:chromosome partitioning protein
MASDDALADGQSRRRWFGGRGSSSGAPSQERETEMAPTEPVIEEVSLQGNADTSAEVNGDAQVEPTPPEPAPAESPAATHIDASPTPPVEAPAAPDVQTPAAPDVEAPAAPDVEAPATPEVEAPPEPKLPPLPVPPEALSSLRARGGQQSGEEIILPLVISIANQKGGVGKTTTAVNLGAALAELDYRVLVIDLDPQGNATTGMGISHRNVEGSIYDVIMNDAPIDDCTEPTTVKNLFVVPATIDLAGAEIELVPAFSRELKLRRALAQIAGSYDFTLIDCPPSLGLLTVNGLAASDDVIVPIQCEYYALEGLGQLLRNVALVKSNLNPALDVRGIVLTMYDARTKLAEQVEREVRAHFGSKVYRTVVPRTVRISEAPSFGQPVTVFDSTSRGALAYRELAKEVSRGATRRAG